MRLQRTFRFQTKEAQEKKLKQLENYICYPSQVGDLFLIHLTFAKRHGKMEFLTRS